MKNEIVIHIPAVPVAQPKGHAVSFGGKARIHPVTHIKNADGTRKPHPIAAFKACVMHAAKEVYDGPPLEGPLRVDCLWLLPRPKRLIWQTRAMPRAYHFVKPDRDNLDKSVLDALTGLLWRDDCQVCDGRLTKMYAAGDEQPHVEIRVFCLDEKTVVALAADVFNFGGDRR